MLKVTVNFCCWNPANSGNCNNIFLRDIQILHESRDFWKDNLKAVKQRTMETCVVIPKEFSLAATAAGARNSAEQSVSVWSSQRIRQGDMFLPSQGTVRYDKLNIYSYVSDEDVSRFTSTTLFLLRNRSIDTKIPNSLHLSNFENFSPYYANWRCIASLQITRRTCRILSRRVCRQKKIQHDNCIQFNLVMNIKSLADSTI